jgi:pimeloyl-ACP methyl ester carboxylesterase
MSRAMIVVHGRKRNAGTYRDIVVDAMAALGGIGADQACLVVAPQFLTEGDAGLHRLPDQTLLWDVAGWMGGDAALSPAPVSSFTVLDAIVDRLFDRSRFPALQDIVIVGHSGGGQVVQRYAILTNRRGAMRFVVANPSSYAYFTAERPADGGFGVPDEARFPGFDRWKYGMIDRPLSGVDGAVERLEARYAAREVVYLLGQADRDPGHPALDRSPAAMVQGRHRLERGRFYFAYLQARHGTGLRHRLIELPGIGHDPLGMFSAAMVRSVLFGPDPAGVP